MLPTIPAEIKKKKHTQIFKKKVNFKKIFNRNKKQKSFDYYFNEFLYIYYIYKKKNNKPNVRFPSSRSSVEGNASVLRTFRPRPTSSFLHLSTMAVLLNLNLLLL